MDRRRRGVMDESAAATELGYIFTFLLGVVFLSTFSIWVWGLESGQRDHWTDEALNENAARVASAVERADKASRLGSNVTYAEPVELLLTENTGLALRLLLSNEEVRITDGSTRWDTRHPVSTSGSGSHGGEIQLIGVNLVWVVHENGVTSVSLARPDA